MDKGKKTTIEKNLSFVEEDKKLFLMDVNRYLISTPFKYDIIYADPPFNMEGKVDLLRKISNKKLVKEGGLFIIHYPEEERKQWLDVDIDGFEFIDERKYGRSMLRFFKAK